MGGFNYGGKGDGTGWSSERGDGTSPGGGSHGTGEVKMIAVTPNLPVGM